MVRRILVLVFLGSFFCSGGCGTDEQLRPEIVYDYNQHSAGTSSRGWQKPSVPEPLVDYTNIPSGWIPSGRLERRWTAVVIHHSATVKGNAAFFNKAHEGRVDVNGNHWKGIGYDFVIGNGTISRDGQVEVTFRWRQQITGAHCRTDGSNWANREAVGICLVGDFSKTAPTRRQMQSLIRLVHFLQDRYNIPAGRIYGHRDTPGVKVTDCPGRKFSMWWLRRLLARG